MRARLICRAGLVAVLSVALSAVPFAAAEAHSGGRGSKPVPENRIPTQGQVDGALIGIIAGLSAAVILAIVLIHRSHQSAKYRTITGCVSAGDHGISLTDEGDKRIYVLSGNMTGIKAGERMTLQGKKINSNDTGKPLGWKTDTIVKDFGACQP